MHVVRRAVRPQGCQNRDRLVQVVSSGIERYCITLDGGGCTEMDRMTCWVT